jgi:integrase
MPSNDSRRVADFHSLRHTFITNPTTCGVYPEDAQLLARHSSITLTLDRYTHVG